MCGFLVALNNNLYSRDNLDSALKIINYRGPDYSGSYIFKNNYLGHNRLKIIDLSDQSNQPFICKDNKFAIVFNGEIYNYKELISKFRLKTVTSSDTEVILELYKMLGRKCLDEINGMFAFVIINLESGNYFVVRDRLGVKPLFQYQNGDLSIFCSEPAPILELTKDDKIDSTGLRQYLKMRSFFNNRTIYKNIKSFPAGHYSDNGPLYCYWKLPVENNSFPTDQEIKDLIIKSINYRLVSDVPVGSFLSGGVDSTIVSILAKIKHTWTIGFQESNEFEWAKMAANLIPSGHNEILVTHEDFLKCAIEMIQIRREPLSVPNEVLLYIMSKKMRLTNKVVLCGEGADELFFGYDRIFRWASTAKNWSNREFESLYCYGTQKDDEIIEDALSPFTNINKPIKRLWHFFQTAHLSGLLRRLDFPTMLASVEAREPFVDYKLIELIGPIDWTHKISINDSKIQLKRIFADIIPNDLLYRKKVGFPVPLAKIFNTDAEQAYDKWLQFNLQTLFNLENQKQMEEFINEYKRV